MLMKTKTVEIPKGVVGVRKNGVEINKENMLKLNQRIKKEIMENEKQRLCGCHEAEKQLSKLPLNDETIKMQEEIENE